MKYALIDRQDKGRMFIEALQRRGWERATSWKGAEFYLIDLDRDWKDLDEAHAHGVPVFLYPHSVWQCLWWDGLYPVWPHTKANFVPAAGHRMVMEAYGYPIPTVITGWPYSQVRPFRPTAGRQILFAPKHPNAAGRMLTQDDRGTNSRTFEALRGAGLRFTVRYAGDLGDNGLKQDPEIRYQRAQLTIEDSILAIEQHDVIIGHQTMAWLAVALGKPTLMMAEGVTPHNIRGPVRSWKKYKRWLQYPLDALATHDVPGLISHACLTDVDIIAWRKRFIGDPFDGARFVDEIERRL